MAWIVANIGRIMLVSGVLTLTMVYAAIAPESAVQSTFGESLSGPVASVIVRNWGALIGLMGAMLIYGAFNPHVRSMALAVAGASKVVFIALVLSQGQRFLTQQAGVAIAIDAIWVAVFGAYLIAARRAPESV
jgi:hypothetical protein